VIYTFITGSKHSEYISSQQLFVTTKSALLSVEINRRISQNKIVMPTEFADITDVKNWGRRIFSGL
jgi:hypothetical protein